MTTAAAAPLPPAPSKSRLWTSWQIMRRPTAFYERCRRDLGDTFTLHAMNGTFVCTCHPDGAKQVFSLKHDQTRPFGAEIAAPLIGHHSVITLHGDAHHRERRVLMPAFHGPRMKAYGDDIRRIAQERMALWPVGQPLVMFDEMSEITFRVIVHAVFGITDPQRAELYLNNLRTLVAQLHPAYLFFRFLQQPWLPGWGRFERARDAVDALIYEDLEARRANGPVTEATAGHDVLSMLLAARYDDGTAMPDVAVRDELMTLLFAGLETTAIALAWSVFRLGKHPDAADWLRKGLARAEAPEQCPELRAFWQEAIRLNTLLPDVLRELNQDTPLQGVQVPADVKVAVMASAIHRREDLFEAPDTFQPQRFVDRKYSPFQFMPFGGGTRRCVGAALATYELELVLGEFIGFLGDRPWRVLSNDVESRRSVTMAPSEGVRIQLDA